MEAALPPREFVARAFTLFCGHAFSISRQVGRTPRCRSSNHQSSGADTYPRVDAQNLEWRWTANDGYDANISRATNAFRSEL